MSLAFIFPGQGSQSVGMMSELLESSPLAEEVFQRASDAISVDLRALALNGPVERINETEITQPLVLTASLAVWEVWKASTEIRPDYVCGHSLGEYTALVTSEVLNIEQAVRLVHLRGQLMQTAVPLGQGAMAALLGLDDEAVVAVCEKAQQGDVVSAANFNSPGQVVISGSNSALERAISLAKEAGAKRAAMLPVSVPCHCSLLEPAGKKLAQAVQETGLQTPKIPVVQNFTASVPADLDALTYNLLQHLHQPVRWADSIRYLRAQGVASFVECGPGKVLTGLNKRIDRDAKSFAISDLAGIHEVQAQLESEGS
jgi:[acyl-carrier-protein] S-malonyltransferase